MRNLIIALFLVVVGQSVSAQILEPVKWTFSAEHISGDEYNLIYKADIHDEWNVYSQHTSDDGPVPTMITYEDESGVEMLGANVEKGHKKEGFDKLFETNVIKFLGDQDFTIIQKVKLKDASKPVKGYLTFMTCNNKTCLPPTDVDFAISLKPSQSKASTPTITKEKKVAVVNNTETSSPNIKIVNSPTHGEATKNKMKVVSLGDVAAGDSGKQKGILEPVKWSFLTEKHSDTEVDLIFKAVIDDEWNVYSQHTSDDGPVPTSITFESLDGAELVGDNVEVGHKKEGHDKLFDTNVIKFLGDQDFTITQRVKLGKNTKKLSGYLTFMTCDDKTCLPPTDIDFSFNFGGDGAHTGTGGTEAVGLVADVDGKVDQKRAGLASFKTPLSSCGDDGSGKEKQSLWWLLLAGILGGFAALLTPCVFPMIPITVGFFTKDTRRKGWVNGLIYGLSIIVIYVGLGLFITFAFGPEVLNSLSTSWIANTLFFIIFLVFAFSFFGFFEITLPSSWTTKTDSMADKGGLLGIFFMAATLSLVSFSCTGPIVGSALVAAAKGGVMGPLVVMFGFSAALALPFGLFAAFPAWLNSLPRSGGWMNSVKVVLGFLEIGFAFKFLSTADLTEHWGFLKYELFMIIWVILAFAIAAYLFGFIKFPHDSPIKKLSIPRKLTATMFTVLGIYFCFGFTLNKDTGIYNSLWLTSGISPPVNYNFFLEGEKVDDNIKAMYSSYTKCANNINCFKDYFEGLAYAKSVGKPMFLDFTGHGCQNCRKTEDNIWVDDRVRKILNDDVVLVSLYVDDRGKLEKPFVSLADGKKKRTVGNQWADFQVVNFEQNSQPLYIMVTPDEEVITHPRGYKDSADDYNDYLRCGLTNFGGS